jgi:hypothetical protein
MDEKFTEAVKRTNHDMDTYLRLMEKEWNAKPNAEQDEKAFKTAIAKMKLEWTKEKRNDWTTPW